MLDEQDSLMQLENFEEDLKICARCGFCKNVCPTYLYSDGFEAFSPRGRLHFLREYAAGREKMSASWVDRLYRCTSCERCMEVCQTSIPLVPLWEAARARAVREGKGPMPAHVRLRNAVAKTGNPYDEPLEKQRGWMQQEHKPAEHADMLVFGGCTASYRIPAMLRTGVSILQRQGIPYMYLGGKEHCCGSPLLRTGQKDIAAEVIAHNIDLINEAGVKQVVTPCGGCSKTLKHDYPLWAKRMGKPWTVEVLHFSEIYASLIKEGKLVPTKAINKTVTYHDPCHVGRAQGLFEEPRVIMAAIPGLKLVEMPHHGKDSRCCGAGGGVKSNYPELADHIAQDRVQEAADTGADMLATMCPFCQGSFMGAVKALNSPLEIIGVDALLLQSMEGDSNDKASAKSGQ
jgi:heterodisulfide reductase subunit D